jgi:hypothetical protein
MDPDCVCGHAEDEHLFEGGCQIDGCDCFYYEPDEDAGNG